MSEVQRDGQGVRKRADGGGDPWAEAHRKELGPTFNMNDVDGYVGMMGFAGNTGDKLFMEYVCDSYENRWKHIRDFAVVALFDRKATKEYALSERNLPSSPFYLYLCRAIGTTQPKPPKFFFVIGSKEPPWTMIELDIQTGKIVREIEIGSGAGTWRAIWQAVGLVALRNELQA